MTSSERVREIARATEAAAVTLKAATEALQELADQAVKARVIDTGLGISMLGGMANSAHAMASAVHQGLEAVALAMDENGSVQ